MGHLLGSIIQSPLSQHTYLRVRTVLLALADMLASLESALSSAADIATRLRAHVSRIDNYMTEAALQQHNNIQIPMAIPPTKGSSHPYLPSLLNVSYLLGILHISSQQYHAPASDVRADFGDLSRQDISHSGPHTSGALPVQDAGGLQQTDPAAWAPSEDIPSTQHFQLPDDLFQDWPFDFGQGDVFDWLGDVQAQAQIQGHVEEVAPPLESWS